MPFVLDASVAVCWAFNDEEHPIATLALDRLGWDSAHAPALWWFEVRNSLIVNERHGRLAEADTAAFLRGLGQLGIILDRTPDETAILTMARRHRLTIYDSAYLELSRRTGFPLATLDSALANAARGEAVELLGLTPAA